MSRARRHESNANLIMNARRNLIISSFFFSWARRMAHANVPRPQSNRAGHVQEQKQDEDVVDEDVKYLVREEVGRMGVADAADPP